MIEVGEICSAAHLVGLSLAFGGVLVADLVTLKAMFSAASTFTPKLELLEILHTSIKIGLLLLIVSGIAIVFDRFENIADVPQKVWSKSMLIGLLLINSSFIQSTVLPYLTRITTKDCSDGALISRISTGYRLKLALCSSVSSLGWFGAFILGTVSVFKSVTFLAILPLLFVLWILLLLITLMFMDLGAAWLKKQALHHS